MATLQDLRGKVFGRLTVLDHAGRNRHGHNMWLCRCTCGTPAAVAGNDLRSGHSQSCGCLQRERLGAATRRHGAKGTAEYGIWQKMRERCQNPNARSYRRYGGRGITVCERWQTFENFLADVGPRPSPQHTLDRYPQRGGNYEPGNVRWATMREQNNNRRDNRRYEYQGALWTIPDLARLHGMAPATLRRRLLVVGEPLEEALSTPVVPRGRWAKERH